MFVPLVLVHVLLSVLVSAQSTTGLVTIQTSVPSTTTTGSVSTTTSGNATASTTSSAAFPSLTGYSPCVANCFGLAISKANCTSEIDVNCYCTRKEFPAAVVSCMAADCPSELVSAETLAQSFCNLATPSTALSFPSSPSSSSLSLTSNISPSSTAPATSTSSSVTTTSTALATPTATGGAASKGISTRTILGIGLIVALSCALQK